MRTLLFTLLMMTVSMLSKAQESNYANQEISAISTMLGGAVTAGVTDNSAIYYNPGALIFVENTNLSIETASLFAGGLRIKNGAGTDLNIQSSFFDIIPSMIAGTVKSKKFSAWTFTYAVLTTSSSLMRFGVRHSMPYDVIQSNPEEELYEGIYEYGNKLRESRAGMAASRKFGENFGFGVAFFGVYNSQEFRLRKEAFASDNSAFPFETLANTRIERELRFSSASLLFQIGAVYKINKSKIGLNVVMPNINIDLIAKGTISETLSVYQPDAGIPFFDTNQYGEDLKTILKLPLNISLGYSRKLIGIEWYLKLTYNAAVSEYTSIKTEANPVYPGDFLEVREKANTVVNFAIGLRKDLREGLSFLGGFRTDFNYDTDVYPGGLEFVARMSYWNLYHFSGGVIWYNDRARITLGGDYAIGVSSGDLQQVNLTEPLETNFLFGIPTNDTRTFYNQINVVLGLGVSF